MASGNGMIGIVLVQVGKRRLRGPTEGSRTLQAAYTSQHSRGYRRNLACFFHFFIFGIGASSLYIGSISTFQQANFPLHTSITIFSKRKYVMYVRYMRVK